MPSIKRAGVKSREVKTGFEAYDGPEPNKRGVYRAKIAQFNYKQFKSGATGYSILLELEAQEGDPKGHAIYDGYPIWTNVVFGDKEAMITREENLNAALGVKDEPNVVFEDGDLASGVKVKTIGGKNPIGTIVNADIKMTTYMESLRPEVDSIFKVREVASKVSRAVSEPVEDEEESEDEVEPDEEQGYDERLAELKGASIADLRTIAESDYDLEIKGLKKLDLIQAILDEEFPVDDEEEEADEEEEDDEIEEEEPDEEEEEEDDERELRAAELEGLTRIQLKTALRAADPDFKVLKSHSDDDLREAVLAAEFGDDEETPF